MYNKEDFRKKINESRQTFINNDYVGIQFWTNGIYERLVSLNGIYVILNFIIVNTLFII